MFTIHNAEAFTQFYCDFIQHWTIFSFEFNFILEIALTLLGRSTKFSVLIPFDLYSRHSPPIWLLISAFGHCQWKKKTTKKNNHSKDELQFRNSISNSYAMANSKMVSSIFSFWRINCSAPFWLINCFRYVFNSAINAIHSSTFFTRSADEACFWNTMEKKKLIRFVNGSKGEPFFCFIHNSPNRWVCPLPFQVVLKAGHTYWYFHRMGSIIPDRYRSASRNLQLYCGPIHDAHEPFSIFSCLRKLKSGMSHILVITHIFFGKQFNIQYTHIMLDLELLLSTQLLLRPFAPRNRTAFPNRPNIFSANSD